jgi:hypothetical protein
MAAIYFAAQWTGKLLPALPEKYLSIQIPLLIIELIKSNCCLTQVTLDEKR